MDHLLLHCDVAHALCGLCFRYLGFIGSCQGLLQVYCFVGGIGLGSMAQLFGNWNMVPSCLMWNVWKEWNHCLFEETKNSLDQLKSMFQCTLLNGQCGGAFLIVHPSLSS